MSSFCLQEIRELDQMITTSWGNSRLVAVSIYVQSNYSDETVMQYLLRRRRKRPYGYDEKAEEDCRCSPIRDWFLNVPINVLEEIALHPLSKQNALIFREARQFVTEMQTCVRLEKQNFEKGRANIMRRNSWRWEMDFQSKTNVGEEASGLWIPCGSGAADLKRNGKSDMVRWWNASLCPQENWETMREAHKTSSCFSYVFLARILKSKHIPVVPHKAVAEVSKIGKCLRSPLFLSLSLTLWLSGGGPAGPPPPTWAQGLRAFPAPWTPLGSPQAFGPPPRKKRKKRW